MSIAAGLSLDSRDVGQLKSLSTRDGGLSEELEAMEGALERVALFLGRLNTRGMREVPYEVQRLLLFSFKLYDVDVSDDVLEDWFWLSTFAEEHQSKPESYVTRLVRALRDGDVQPALEVRKPVDPELLAVRSRRAGSAVAVGFDLLLRRMGARSLLSGEAIDVQEGLHGPLFTRNDLADARDDGLRVPSGGPVANLVLLSQTDAIEWRYLRKNHTVIDLFELCQSRTGRAAEIWASQGLSGIRDRSTAEILRGRSFDLLGQVIPAEILQPDGAVARFEGTSHWSQIQRAVQRFIGFDPSQEPVGDRLTDLRIAMIALVDELGEWAGLDDWLESERMLGATLGRQVLEQSQTSDSVDRKLEILGPYQLWAQALSTNLRVLRSRGYDPEVLSDLRNNADRQRQELQEFNGWSSSTAE